MQALLRILIVAMLAMAGAPGASADAAATTERSTCGCGERCACGPTCPCAAPADPAPERPTPTPAPARSSDHWRMSEPAPCEPMTFGDSPPPQVGWSVASERPRHRDARGIRLAACVFLI